MLYQCRRSPFAGVMEVQQALVALAYTFPVGIGEQLSALCASGATYQHATVEGHKIFCREAGPTIAPTIPLLHGFPTWSHMFRNLIPALAEEYHVPIMPGFPSFVPTVPHHDHVVAPDLPGFGFWDAPDRKRFNDTFEDLAK